MPPTLDIETTDRDPWQLLETYRQRYRIEDRLGSIHSLEKSLSRRQVRLAALNRRLDDLEKMLGEVLAELKAVEDEIAGSRATGALLITQVLDEIRNEMGEAWSPTAVRGFRVWRIEDNMVKGNQVHWETPKLSSVCLRSLPGEDLPHPISSCGPPACGIYAVKSLDWFPSGVGEGLIDRSMVGVVGLSGKVVEHADGYRGQHGTVLAMSVNHWSRWLMTNDPGVIGPFFENPRDVIHEVGTHTKPDPAMVRRFLDKCREETTWT